VTPPLRRAEAGLTGRRRWRRVATALLTAIVASASGCSRREPVVVVDLVARLPIAARQAGPREIVLFGTPAAQAAQAEGFFRWPGGPGDRFVWARKEVEVGLSFDAPAERVAVVELQPFAGVPRQAAEVFLNGTAVGHLALAEYRNRYWLDLPAAPQRAGENRLRFVFAATASAADVDPKSRDGGQLAAAFYSLIVGRAGDRGLETLLLRDSPRPFGVSESSGAPGFVLWGGTAASFAVDLPVESVLRFTPRLHAASRAQGGTATFVVTLEREGEPAHEVWRLTLGPRDPDPGEVSLNLGAGEAGIARLSLRVDEGAGGRSAWGVWEAPRVLAREDDTAEKKAIRQGEALARSLAADDVLVVFLDAARAGHFGCYGYARATTPNIDRIAAEGVVFERAYTPAVYTLGAMSAVWTSQQPDPHPGELSFASRLPRDRLTLAELLSAQGIHTAGFVANAMAGRALGFDRGFQEFHELFGDPELGSRAGVFRPALKRFLEENGSRRFFAYLHFREPHFPYDPPPPFDERFGAGGPLPPGAARERSWYLGVNRGTTQPSPAEIDELVRLYDGNLAYADQELGALREALEAAGLWERTTLVIAADHGEEFFEHGYISHSAQVYEESTRVPLIVKLAGQTSPRGLRIRSLVSLADLAPTIADLMGVLGKGGTDRSFDGQSLLPVMLGGPGRPFVVSRTVWDRPVYALRDERFKYVRATATGAEQLYDLASDPAERQDVARSRPLRLEYYRQTLDEWLSRLRARQAGADEPARLSPEQCENMKSLGYVEGCP